MKNQNTTTESQIQKFINADHAIMNFQPVIKLDKFGKKKIDRIIVLTSHQILIIYEGGLELELKSVLDIKYLDYVIKNAKEEANEIMLCFNNKQKSCMHMVLQEDLEEFFDLLKLRWINFNPNKTLKVFGVPENTLLQYHTSGSKSYNIVNNPPEDTRMRDQEVISQEEYSQMKKGGPEIIDNNADNFDFENSRGVKGLDPTT